jgi:hypothetical protein
MDLKQPLQFSRNATGKTTADMDNRMPPMPVETVGGMKAMLFQHALKQRPKETMKALCEEVQKALKINVWKPS